MDRANLVVELKELRDLILEERRAARDLAVEDMLVLTEQKEQVLKQILPLVDTVEALTPEEREMAEAVYSENLRNAYFFWSALSWVRESVGFIGDQISCRSYGESGAMSKFRQSGALLSGRV